MLRAIVTVFSGTLASRLLGFMRDAMVAALLGAGPVADAFLIAFQFVAVIRRLLTEGALNAALIPLWMKIRGEEGDAAAAAFAGRVLGTVSAILILAAVMLGIAMPFALVLLAPGFAGYPVLDLAVANARLMLPYLAFAGPVAVMMAVLNAQRRYTLTSFSPLLFNMALILVVTLLIADHIVPAAAAQMLAATVGMVGLFQLSALALGSSGMARPLRVSFDQDIGRFFARAAPGMVATLAPQLLVLAGAVVASTLPSAVSWLYYANRLIELPLGLVGIAMGTVLLPELTGALHEGDDDTAARVQSRALVLAAGVTLPATLGLIVLSAPIVRLLFEHGAFAAADTAGTARMLALLALGLPAHVLVKTLAPAFFARHDTGAPLTAALLGLGLALVIGFAAASRFGADGISAAIALGAWGSALLLGWRARSGFGLALDRADWRRIAGIAGATLAMTAALWLARSALPAAAGTAAQAVGLALLIALGFAAYGIGLLVLGVIGRDDVAGLLRRARGGLRA